MPTKTNAKKYIKDMCNVSKYLNKSKTIVKRVEQDIREYINSIKKEDEDSQELVYYTEDLYREIENLNIKISSLLPVINKDYIEIYKGSVSKDLKKDIIYDIKETIQEYKKSTFYDYGIVRRFKNDDTIGYIIDNLLKEHYHVTKSYSYSKSDILNNLKEKITSKYQLSVSIVDIGGCKIEEIIDKIVSSNISNGVLSVG